MVGNYVWILRRLFYTVIVVFALTTVVFLSLHLLPGDPVHALVGERASHESVERIRLKYNLDKPLYIQYATWLRNVLRGDFGTSILSKRPVIDEIMAKLPHTLELIILSQSIAILLAIFLGVLSAVKQHTILDYLTTVLSVLGVSMPAFWLALMLIITFSVKLDWFPTHGLMGTGVPLRTISQSYLIDALLTGNLLALESFLKHAFLPCVVLATIPLSYITRLTRSSMLEVMNEEYVWTARAKGLREFKVIFKHALRNALIPVIIMSGVITGLLMGGAVLTETVFGLPGMGRLLVDSIAVRDFPVALACVLLFAAGYNLINLAADIVCGLVDVRASYD